MRKRFYILFVARDPEGQLHKIQIPVYYLYVLVIGAAIGLLSVTGIVGSYARMLAKVSRFNQLRDETEALKARYSKLEQAEHEKDLQVASLGSLAGEVSALYGLKSDPILTSNSAGNFEQQQVGLSMDQLHALRSSAQSGATMIAIGMNISHPASMNDWIRASAAPALWPVMGRITSSFGERIDPFNGEGAFHRGVDISCDYGEPVIAPADGEVAFADFMNGYGRAIILEHGHGLSTLYGHLSSFAVVAGQQIHRGDVIGYIGDSGRSTGPHLHYEVRINDVPVNPYKYLRVTVARDFGIEHGS
ncbi:MAG TPA: M23 family metallopeptidase [Terriglobales bacterium]